MTRARLYSLAGALSALSLAFVACGDGESNNPGDDSGGQGGASTGGGSGSDECPSYLTECSDECVNTEIDSRHCGGCGEECGNAQICVGGECVASDCPTGQASCSDLCVSLDSDRANCGECGAECGDGELCSQGGCVASCGEGLIACNNSCVDPSADPQYCGATSCDAGAGGSGSGVECGALEACVIGECREFIRVWNQGQRVDTNTTDVGQEQSIAVDAAGNALLIWRQKTSSSDTTTDSMRVFASYYDASTKSWSQQQRIDDDSVRVRNLKAAMAPNGDAIAVWVAGPATTGDVFSDPSQVKSAHFNGTTKAWDAPVRLDTQTGPADTPDVAVDADGDAIVAWSQLEDGAGTYQRIYVDRYVDGAFQPVEVIASQGEGQAQLPQVALNDAGQIAIVWEELNETDQIWMPLVSRYTGTWSAPLDLRTSSSQSAGNWGREPDVAVDDAGDITVVFTDDTFTVDVSVMTSVYDQSAGTWSTSAPAETLSVPVTNPKLVVDRNGRATVVFQAAEIITADDQANGLGFEGDLKDFNDIYAARRSASGTWATQIRLVDVEPGSRAYPQVRADEQGNAFAFWIGPGKVWTSRFAIVSGLWIGPESLAEEGDTGVGSPDLAVSASGNALGSWVQQDNGTFHIFVSRYD